MRVRQATKKTGYRINAHVRNLGNRRADALVLTESHERSFLVRSGHRDRLSFLDDLLLAEVPLIAVGALRALDPARVRG